MDNSTLHSQNNTNAGADKDNSFTTVTRNIMGASSEQTEHDSDAHTAPIDDKSGSRQLPKPHPILSMGTKKTYSGIRDSK
jgi:hypothetical protein